MPTPPAPRSLWLVRHGESLGNVARERAESGGLDVIELADRDMDVPLSDLGREQAADLGRWLAAQPAEQRPDVVLSSPYVRAEQTARGILDADPSLATVPLVVDERLRERELGVLDLITSHGMRTRFPEEAERRRKLGKFYHRPPGGESWVDMLLRLRSVWADVGRDHDDRRVLVVTHEVVVLLFRYLIEGMTEQQVFELNRSVQLTNCGLTTFERTDDGLRLDRFDDATPLQRVPVTEGPDVAAGRR